MSDMEMLLLIPMMLPVIRPCLDPNSKAFSCTHSFLHSQAFLVHLLCVSHCTREITKMWFLLLKSSKPMGKQISTFINHQVVSSVARTWTRYCGNPEHELCLEEPGSDNWTRPWMANRKVCDCVCVYLCGLCRERQEQRLYEGCWPVWMHNLCP